MTTYTFGKLAAFAPIEFATDVDRLNFDARASAADFTLTNDSDPDAMRLTGLGKVVLLVSDDRVSLPELRMRQFVFADGSKLTFTHRTNDYDTTLTGTSHDDLLIGSQAALPLTLASRGSGRGPANDASGPGVLSGDGRYLAFSSLASDLVASGDNPGGYDVFVRDLARGTTKQVEILGASDNDWNVTAPSTSIDGSVVTFVCNAMTALNPNGVFEVYAGGVSGAQSLMRALNFDAVDGSSYNVALSGDGTRVAYESFASNLVPADINGSTDVFIQSAVNPGGATLVSVSAQGGNGNGSSTTPTVSYDGRYVAFMSNADNLVAGDDNEISDIFVRDLVDNTTRLVSTDANGSQADQNSFGPVISANGKFVAFLTLDDSLAPGDNNQNNTDIVIKNLETQEVKLVSADANGVARSAFESVGSFEHYGLALSANGRFVVFADAANNLVPNDVDGAQDVFVKDMTTGKIARIRTQADPLTYAGDSAAPTITADGSRIGFLNAFNENDWQNYVVDNPLFSMKLTGGKGNDTYQVARTGDAIVEAAGGGIDTVRSSVSYKLGSQVENLQLDGKANLAATGNSLDNVLTGNVGNNRLDGGSGSDTASYAGAIDSVSVSLARLGSAQKTGSAGSDTLVSIENLLGSKFDDKLSGDAKANRLDGGAGGDRLAGATGNDTYGVDSTLDVVVESARQGTDTVRSSVNYTLGKDVENLVLLGTATRAAGNSADNVITGNALANVLDGKGGSDKLTGHGGKDVFVMASLNGSDTIGDFKSKTDDLRIDARALDVGDGDARLEGALVRASAGKFDSSAELVIFSADLSGKLTASAASKAIGKANDAFDRGDQRVFVVDNGHDSAVYLFESNANDAAVSAAELHLLATLKGSETALGDYLFG